VLFDVLNDESIAGQIGLVTTDLSLFSRRTPGLPLLFFRSMQFLETNNLQGSVLRAVVMILLKIFC